MYALADSAEALQFIDLLMHRGCPGTLAVLMEDTGLPGTCIAVDGGGHPDAVFTVSITVTAKCLRNPHVAGVVLASFRPTLRPDCEDIDRWFELVNDFEQIGVDLLEWFILGPGFAVGMRAMTGCRSAWEDGWRRPSR